jgi:hypothetical protein
MKEVLVIVILLTLSQVSFGKAQTTSLQTESSSRSCTLEMSEMPLMSSASNTNMCLNAKEMPNKKIVCVVEYRKKCNNDNALLPVKRENLSKMNATTNISGKQVKNLLSKKMANLLYAVSVEEFSILRIKTDSLSGTKDITTPFVSYYPGLLNEKIL